MSEDVKEEEIAVIVAAIYAYLEGKAYEKEPVQESIHESEVRYAPFLHIEQRKQNIISGWRRSLGYTNTNYYLTKLR